MEQRIAKSHESVFKTRFRKPKFAYQILVAFQIFEKFEF